MKPYKCECGGWVVEKNQHSHRCKPDKPLKKRSTAKTKKERVSKYETRYGLDG